MCDILAANGTVCRPPGAGVVLLALVKVFCLLRPSYKSKLATDQRRIDPIWTKCWGFIDEHGTATGAKV